MRASGYDRVADDWYVEPSWCIDALLVAEPPFKGLCADPACGGGNIPRRMRTAGVECFGADIVDRGYGVQRDFFLDDTQYTSVISNPPYGPLQEFVEHALIFTTDRVAVLARLAFLEGQARRSFFKSTPLARVWVSSRRISMPPGGKDVPAKGGAIAYAWYVWEHGYRGKPTLGWLENT